MPNEFNIKNGFITSGNSNVFATLTARKLTGGSGNTNSAIYSFIGGGTFNTITASTSCFSSISSGVRNNNSGPSSFIGSGSGNTIGTNGFYSFIGAGCGNSNNGSNSFVGVGMNNSSGGNCSSVLNGVCNCTILNHATILNGICNVNWANMGFIGSGFKNTTCSSYSFIGNGVQNLNTISTYCPNNNSAIVGGTLNCTSSGYYGSGHNFIGNGCSNSIVGSSFTSIVGGLTNTATFDYSFIGGGCSNTASARYSFIGGGHRHIASGLGSFVGGGVCNTSSGNYNVVAGGNQNINSGDTSFIGGGAFNIAGGSQSTVAGGRSNRALASCSFVGGGLCNSSCSIQSFIGGGLRNTVTGNVSGVVGGSGNTVSGNYSFAAGCGLNATANLTFYTNNSCSTTAVYTPTFSGGSLTLSNSASTISLNNTTRQQIRFFSGGTGTPTYNSYSAGAKIIFSDNISSISSGYAIGVDTGSLWYGVDLAGNGHDWYAGTNKLASLISSAGFQLYGLGSITTAAFTISGTSSLGSKGGLGYMDFLRVYNNYPSATNPNKWFRTTSGGTLQILRDDYNATIFDLTNSGVFSVGGGNIATATSQDATSNYLSFNSNNTQIYDDGNTHIHSRGAGQSMWINTNGGQLNLLTQSPTATGGIGSGIAIATGTLNGYVTINTGRTVTTAANYGYLTTGGAGTYPGGSQSVVISLYANSRIWGQEIDAFSDERMKDIHGKITLEDGIKLVKNLIPIKYNWKEGDDKGVKAGYSAQQVIKAGFDHLIGLIPTEGLEETIDEDGFLSPKDTQFAMNYDQVTPYHGVVIKHLLEEIENLKNEIKELKNKVG